MRGRLALLTCLFSCALLAPVVAQTPGAPATPAPKAAGAAKPSASPAPAVSPSSAASPVATPKAAATPVPWATPQSRLDFPTEAERKAYADRWKRSGAVGQSTFIDKVRTVTWALGFVLLLIWLASKVVSKTTLEKIGLPVESDSLIEVLEKKRISPGRSIMMVRVGPKVLAVAITETGFRTLTEIDGEALKLHQDELKVEGATVEKAAAPVVGATTPADVAKHYLSIIPGLGAKK